MEIVIHGSKRGQQEFYNSNPKIKDVAKDFRSGSAPKAVTEKAKGRELYGLNYSKEGIVFSKIIIILDKPRQDAIGFVAFSLVLNSKKIIAENIKSILDEYAEAYFKNYNIVDNVIASVYSDDANFNKDLLDKLKQRYPVTTETFALTNLNYYQSENKNPAYIYYNSVEDLYKYFNNPFWTEYTKNSMVFLIDSKYKGTPENPLNALRHTEEDNLTGKIDNTERPFKFKLEDIKPPYEKIEIELNNFSVETGVYFRTQDNLKIKLINKFFKDKVIKGDEAKYFIRNDLVHTLNLKAVESELVPKTESITFNIKDDEGRPLNSNFKFKIKSLTKSFDRVSIGQKLSIEFKGPQIGEEWELEYISSDNSSDKYFLKELVIINPEKEENERTITLTQYKEIEIVDYDSRDPIKNVNLKLKSANEIKSNKDDKVSFEGSQITKKWKVEFDSSWISVDNKYKIETKEISPDEDSVIILKKKVTYTIVLEDGRKLPVPGFYYKEYATTEGRNKNLFRQIKEKIKDANAVPEGKKIVDYEVNDKNKIHIKSSEKNKFFKKIFELKKTKLYAFIATAVLFLIIGVGGAYFFIGNKKHKPDSTIEKTQPMSSQDDSPNSEAVNGEGTFDKNDNRTWCFR